MTSEFIKRIILIYKNSDDVEKKLLARYILSTEAGRIHQDGIENNCFSMDMFDDMNAIDEALAQESKQ